MFKTSWYNGQWIYGVLSTASKVFLVYTTQLHSMLCNYNALSQPQYYPIVSSKTIFYRFTVSVVMFNRKNYENTKLKRSENVPLTLFIPLIDHKSVPFSKVEVIRREY